MPLPSGKGKDNSTRPYLVKGGINLTITERLASAFSILVYPPYFFAPCFLRSSIISLWLPFMAQRSGV